MKKTSWIRSLCTLALAAGTLLAALPAAAAGEEKVLHVAWNADMLTMDVHKDSNNYCVPLNIYDRLFEIQLNDDGTTELVKSLVEDYSVSEDGLVYDFTLRDDVKFSDGTPLTSADVEFTFTRMLALEDSMQTDFASAIKGAQAVIDHETDTLEGFTVVDDTHFQITLGAPFAGYLYQLATPSCSIFSKKNVEEAGEDFGIDPEKTIGSGPYTITDWVRGSSVTLEANPVYWGEQPSASRVEIGIYDSADMDMAFQKGEIDILDCDFLDAAIVEAEYTAYPEEKLVKANRLATTYMVLNENVEPLADVRVRKAIQMAINRQAILDAIYMGMGHLEDGIYPRGLIGYSEENQGWLQYDPDGAKALLEEAGYGDGFDLELASDASAVSSVANVLQIIEQDLNAVGIHATIQSYDGSAWKALRNSGEMESFVGTWTADDNDPDNFIYTFFGSKDNTKIRSINYKDEEVIGRVAAARTIIDEQERLAEYAALEKKLVEEDAAWVPMYSRTHLFVLGDNVEKLVPHWAGYNDMSYAGVTMK